MTALGRPCLSLLAAAVLLVSLCSAQSSPQLPFRVAIYIPVGQVEKMKDPTYLETSWAEIGSQVHIDKAYIETYRSGVIADNAVLPC